MLPEHGDHPQSEPVRLEGLDAVRSGAVEIIRAARREVLILSSDLQAPLYDQPPFLEALRHLVISGQRPTIRVLAADTTVAVQHGHRLIELSRKLSSFIELKRLAAADSDIAETFLLADRQRHIRQPLLETSRIAILNMHAPPEGRLLAQRFQELWDRAETDPNLRQLSL